MGQASLQRSRLACSSLSSPPNQSAPAPVSDWSSAIASSVTGVAVKLNLNQSRAKHASKCGFRLTGSNEPEGIMTDINQFLANYGLPLVFGAVFVEQIGIPLPAIPWLLAVGALSATGDYSPRLAIIL